MRSADLERILLKSEVFEGVAPGLVRALAGGALRHTFKRKATIFLKGQRSEFLYAVVSGRVSIGTSSDEGHVLFHRILGPGDVFGEIGLLDGGPRTASARAQEATDLLLIGRAAFLALLHECPALSVRLLATLARRLRSTSQMLEDTLFLTARDRVARRLCELARSSGTPSGSAIVLSRMTQEDLASMVGLSRQHVSTQLTCLRKDGLVETRHGRIVLKDIERLEELCSVHLVEGED